MVEWLSDHPEIYQRSHGNYYKKKDDLWQDQAQAIGVVDGKTLKTWYESLRTRWGKMDEKKSGQASPDFTERDKWVWEKFQFLRGHIKHQVFLSTI